MEHIIEAMRKEAKQAADVSNYDLYGTLTVYADQIEKEWEDHLLQDQADLEWHRP